MLKFSFAGGPPLPPGSGGNGNPGGNGNGNGNPGGGACWPPKKCVPIDGGIVFLIVGGVVYGVYSSYRITNNKIED